VPALPIWLSLVVAFAARNSAVVFTKWYPQYRMKYGERYMPSIAVETIPDAINFAGYAWAALMFALGAGTVAVATTGDLKLWAIYVSVVAVGAKVLAFALQYIVFRVLVINRIRAGRAAAT